MSLRLKTTTVRVANAGPLPPVSIRTFHTTHGASPEMPCPAPVDVGSQPR